MKKNSEFKIVPVIACLVTMLCVGIEYMWSVFQKPVLGYFSAWNSTAVTMISSAMICMFVVGIFVGGILIAKIKARFVVMSGGVLFFLGLFLTSLLPADLPESRAWYIYITYGVIAGTGVGFAYAGAINCVQQWLPHRRGFATGICVCAFGLSIVIFSPAATAMLEVGVPFTFRMFSIIVGTIVFLMSFFLKSPASGYASRLGVKQLQARDAYSLKEAIRDPRFWFMCSALFFGTAANMIINPRVKVLAPFRDISSLQADVTVSLIGVSAALSRLILPTLSDKVSRSKMIFAMMVVMMLASFLMTFAEGFLYTAAIFMIVFAYSGPAGIYPAMAGDAFGMKNMSSIFGLAFLCIGLSSITFGTLLPNLINPNATKAGLEGYGDYKLIFIIGAVTNVIPMVCMLVYDKVGKKKDAQRAAIN